MAFNDYIDEILKSEDFSEDYIQKSMDEFTDEVSDFIAEVQEVAKSEHGVEISVEEVLKSIGEEELEKAFYHKMGLGTAEGIKQSSAKETHAKNESSRIKQEKENMGGNIVGRVKQGISERKELYNIAGKAADGKATDADKRRANYISGTSWMDRLRGYKKPKSGEDVGSKTKATMEELNKEPSKFGNAASATASAIRNKKKKTEDEESAKSMTHDQMTAMILLKSMPTELRDGFLKSMETEIISKSRVNMLFKSEDDLDAPKTHKRSYAPKGMPKEEQDAWVSKQTPRWHRMVEKELKAPVKEPSESDED